MTRELIIRAVPGHGFLPIVREYNLIDGKPGKEIYRGDFRATVLEATVAGQQFLESGA